MYHSCIPKLVELGAVTFDETSGGVARGVRAPAVLAALEGIGTALDDVRDPSDGDNTDDELEGE